MTVSSTSRKNFARLAVIPAALAALAAGTAFSQPAHAQRDPFKTHHQIAFVNRSPFKVLEFWISDGKKGGFDVDYLAAIDVEPGNYSTQDFMIPVSQPCFMTVEVGFWDTRKNKKQYVKFENQNVCVPQRFGFEYTEADATFHIRYE